MSDADDTKELWAEYTASRAREVRDKLIIQYSPLVKYVAGRVAVGLPANVEQADLVSYGVFGLINAIERFEPARGFKFETYAIPRIRGAILDELRSMDWVPRSVRAKARSVETAIAKLEAVWGRAPSDEEVAAELEISVDDLRKVSDGDLKLKAGDTGPGVEELQRALGLDVTGVYDDATVDRITAFQKANDLPEDGAIDGDTLYGLSRKYGTSVSAIQRANKLKGTTIVRGKTLLIPR